MAEPLHGHIRRVLPQLAPEAAEDLARVVERIVATFRPERIYVFGSQARGEATVDSDVDILVVVPESDLLPHRRDQLAFQAVGAHLTPLDILVMTREEFESRRLVVSSLPATVEREGQILYAA